MKKLRYLALLIFLIPSVLFAGQKFPPQNLPSNTAYDATTWNNNPDAATKGVLQDKFDSITISPTFTTDITVQGLTGAMSCVNLTSDAGEDNNDKWRICVADGGDTTLESYASGAWVAKWTISNAGVFTTASSIGIGVTPTASHNLDILMSATDINAIKIDGTTNDYTGASAPTIMQIDRDMNRGTGSVINAAGWQSYLNQIHTDAVLTGDREVYGSISRFNNQGAITNTTASDYQYWTNGAHNTAKMHPTATFDTDSTGILEIAITGTYGYAFADGGWTIYDTGGLSPANTVVASGVRSFVENSLTLDGTAAATVINAGFYVETVLGSTAGTSIGAGLYIPNGIITGSDTNYGVYDISDLPWLVEGAISTGGIFTVTPDGTNEVFQVNDGTIDFTDGNGGTAGTFTIDASGNISFNKNFTTTGGRTHALTATSADGYSVLTSDEHISVDVNGAEKSVVIPTALNITGRVFHIHDQEGEAGVDNIIIKTEGATLFMSASGETSTYTIAANGNSVSIIFDGSRWKIF